jgi:hypothetical protein
MKNTNKTKMKSKIRNKPCECGSGKKTKKCFPFHKNQTNNTNGFSMTVRTMNGLRGSDLLNDLCDRIDKKKLNLPNEIKYGFSTSYYNNKSNEGIWELEIKNPTTDMGLVLREVFEPNILEIFVYPFNYSKGEIHKTTWVMNTDEVKRELWKLDKTIENFFSIDLSSLKVLQNKMSNRGFKTYQYDPTNMTYTSI